jgi:hypothetical protein
MKVNLEICTLKMRIETDSHGLMRNPSPDGSGILLCQFLLRQFAPLVWRKR